MQKIFSNHHDLPSLTSLGFAKTKVPLNIWNILQDSYNILKQLPPEEESFADLDPKYKNNSHSELFNFKQLESIGNYVIEELKDIHEWWCKESLIPSTIWGFRSYRTNSNMDNHIDWINKQTKAIKKLEKKTLLLKRMLEEPDKEYNAMIVSKEEKIKIWIKELNIFTTLYGEFNYDKLIIGEECNVKGYLFLDNCHENIKCVISN